MNILRIISAFFKLLLLVAFLIVAFGMTQFLFFSDKTEADHPQAVSQEMSSDMDGDSSKEKEILPFTLDDLPAYSGSPYVEVNDNQPYFTLDGKRSNSYDNFSPLDELGRCGAAIACIGPDIMPDTPREAIGMIKPSGWHTVKYSDLIEDQYLYNRCHLIGYQLTGQNANEENLITGTRYLNATGMEPWECMIANYVRSSGNHVLYRVTPIYEGKNLVASGVLMEAASVEDHAEGICFNIFCYNVQPGIRIDYKTGDSQREVDQETATKTDHKNDHSSSNYETLDQVSTDTTYVINTNTNKFHLPSCDSVYEIKRSNAQESKQSREELMEQGYDPCKGCNP